MLLPTFFLFRLAGNRYINTDVLRLITDKLQFLPSLKRWGAVCRSTREMVDRAALQDCLSKTGYVMCGPIFLDPYSASCWKCVRNCRVVWKTRCDESFDDLKMRPSGLDVVGLEADLGSCKTLRVHTSSGFHVPVRIPRFLNKKFFKRYMRPCTIRGGED